MSDQLTEAMHGFGMQDFCRRFNVIKLDILYQINLLQKSKWTKNLWETVFADFLKNQNLSTKKLVVIFSKSPPVPHFIYVSDFCRRFNENYEKMKKIIATSCFSGSVLLC